MEIVKFIYLNQEVEFNITNNDIMVNATEMAKIFGKQIGHFLENDSTQKFINECLKHCKNKTGNMVISKSELDINNRNSDYLDNEKKDFIADILNIENKDDLIISKPKSGTWMHRVLALKFAAWLEPAFDLWVYATIDILINNFFKEQKDALIEKLTAKQRKQAQRQLLLDRFANVPEIAEYFELEDAEKEAHRKRMKSIREQMSQLKFQFKF